MGVGACPQIRYLRQHPQQGAGGRAPTGRSGGQSSPEAKAYTTLDASRKAFSDVECQVCPTTTFRLVSRYMWFPGADQRQHLQRQLTTDHLHLFFVHKCLIVCVFLPVLPVLIQCHADNIWCELGWWGSSEVVDVIAKVLSYRPHLVKMTLVWR